MTRQQANRRILDRLYSIIEKYPDLRFHQILQSTKLLQVEYTEPKSTKDLSSPYVLDNFYEESEATLKRMIGSE